MNEDAELNDFLKERLEDGVPGEPPRLDAILHAASTAAQTRAAARRSRVRLWGGLLVAASLTMICLFAVHYWSPLPSPSSPSSPPAPQVAVQSTPSPTPASIPSPEQTVVDAIDLLSMADGENLGVETNSVEEVLLAWQDAPYENAVADLLAGN